ncbi:MAG: N-acetyltransferase [Nitrosomonas sp.]|nr:MAG: N-acetyltransferase [Nitrosomonas sp.]
MFRAESTYSLSPEITEEEAKRVWVNAPEATYVCEDGNNKIIGTYYLKPNQPALGAHVCNCGYIVDENARGQGVTSAVYKHSQKKAVRLGFIAMQYNLVVSTNESVIRLWKRHDFKVTGVLPKAFNHKYQGFVDALLMYKQLQA